MSNKTIGVVVAGVLIVGGYYLFFSKNNEVPAKSETPKTTMEDQQKTVAADFVKKYPINTNVSKDIKYSFEFEDQIIKPGKPIIFTGYVDDIFRKNGELYIRFAPTFWDSIIGIQQFYSLSGCADKIPEIVSREKMSDNPFGQGEYVVVAKIDSIKKPTLGIGGSIDGEDVELDYQASATFLATGSCIDLAYITEE